MKYFKSITDKYGYIHSIDNLIIEYEYKGMGNSSISCIIKDIQDICSKYDKNNYWEKLDVKPCSKYQYYSNHIHVDDGIYLSVGRYKDCDSVNKNMTLWALVKLEVNPNKHYGKPILSELVEYFTRNSFAVNLKRYDYAIDIPVKPADVQIFGSRKEKGLYKGTRYFGQRNHHGFCKIYDKQKEQELESPLTRVEHTFSNVKYTKQYSFENIYIKDDSAISDIKLNSTNQVLLELILALKENDIEYDSYINKLDKRTKRTILEALNGFKYKVLEFDYSILETLIIETMQIFGNESILGIDKPAASHHDYEIDKDGFIIVPDDIDDLIPF